jgi:protein gp37
MGIRTAIEWTDTTWTPIRARHHLPGTDEKYDRIGWHCEHVSEACRNCYAETWNEFRGTGRPYKPAELAATVTPFLDEKMLLAPLHWKKPRRIFVCSMTDLFANFVPDAWIDKVFAIMALCPQHTFQVLTKRPERMRDYFRGGITHALTVGTGLPNVWLGTSVEDQATADERIPLLLNTPAAKRFLSCEPLLGPTNVASIYQGSEIIKPLAGVTWYPTPKDWPTQGITARHSPKIDWVIAGGESGPNARPMHPDWPRTIRDQCAVAGVPFFFKQWGEWLPVCQTGDHVRAHEVAIVMKNGTWGTAGPGDTVHQDDGTVTFKIGKKAAGNILDGCEHKGFPDGT